MAASYDLDREPHNNMATDIGSHIQNPQPTNTSHHAIAEFIWGLFIPDESQAMVQEDIVAY